MMQCLVADVIPATGVEAELIRRKEAEIRRDYIDAPLTGAPLRLALKSLAGVVQETSSSNWDGYGAASINLSAVRHAVRLLSHVPPEIQAPEISADPDGEVSLEWYQGPRHVFSVSVSPAATLSYAGMFGRNSVYGAEDFTDDYLPVAIRVNLRRLFGSSGRSL